MTVSRRIRIENSNNQIQEKLGRLKRQRRNQDQRKTQNSRRHINARRPRLSKGLGKSIKCHETMEKKRKPFPGTQSREEQQGEKNRQRHRRIMPE
ncbi:hypothetical protein VTJ04DRAFT_3601 [Mycothermus thermophilus]|uniref:uncharacterized protein n=1 Tax=Humicola insolens TaxID=85995 RepID=UPI0037421BD2